MRLVSGRCTWLDVTIILRFSAVCWFNNNHLVTLLQNKQLLTPFSCFPAPLSFAFCLSLTGRTALDFPLSQGQLENEYSRLGLMNYPLSTVTEGWWFVALHQVCFCTSWTLSRTWAKSLLRQKLKVRILSYLELYFFCDIPRLTFASTQVLVFLISIPCLSVVNTIGLLCLANTCHSLLFKCQAESSKKYNKEIRPGTPWVILHLCEVRTRNNYINKFIIGLNHWLIQ